MEDFYERYLIKKDGSIYSLYSRFGRRPKPLLMTPQLKKDGYYRVMLTDRFGNKKNFLLHRLIANKFIDNPKKMPEVNHINGDKKDNRADNLEWVTRSENLRHRYRVLGCGINKGFRKYIDGRKAKTICVETGEIFDSVTSAAKSVDMNIGNIYQSFRTGCACAGFHWEKIDKDKML